METQTTITQNVAPELVAAKSFEGITASDDIDLLQIYPSKTNNLNFINYQNNGNQDADKCCCVDLMKLIRFILGFVIFILICTIGLLSFELFNKIEDVPSNPILWLILMIIILKFYLFYQSYCYIKYSQNNSIYHHEYGMRLYYGLYADLPIIFLLSTFGLLISLWYGGNWNGGLSLFIASLALFSYSIFGFVLVKNKLPKYFEAVSYKNYEKTNDKKYCLFYHYNDKYPSKISCAGILSSIGSEGNCFDDYDNSETPPKCGILAISVLMIIMSVVLLALPFVFYFPYFYYGLSATIGIALILIIFHAMPGYYGIKLVNCQTPNEFHKYTHLSFVYYCILGGIYYYMFGLVFALLFHNFLKRLLIIIIYCFISYLPWQAVGLIDSNAKWETYKAKNLSNQSQNVINMESGPEGGGNQEGANQASGVNVVTALQDVKTT